MTVEIRNLKVAGGEHGCLLQELLCERLGLSRNRAKALLDQRAVFVNQRRVWMAKHPLEAGDIVEVRAPSKSARPPPAKLIDILYEDEQYMVINKPAGMLSNGERSAEGLLKEHFKSMEIHAVHRLDRDTSGCLLVAKNMAAFEAMVDVFQKREVRKTYLALASRRVPPALRIIRAPVDGQEAITHIKTTRSNHRASLLELHPETGRTHQLRRHLASAGHPLIGDKQYETRAVTDDDARHVARQMLHASRLSFKQPISGVAVDVTCPAPADFISAKRALALG